jgi:hypothetical protein
VFDLFSLLLVVCHSTFSIITSLYNTTIDSIAQFDYRNRAHATEDGDYIQDRGYILGQRKGAASSLPIYCAFALALLEQNFAITLDFFETTGSTGLSLLVDGRCHRRRIRIGKGYVTQAFHIYPQALYVHVTLHHTPEDTKGQTQAYYTQQDMAEWEGTYTKAQQSPLDS